MSEVNHRRNGKKYSTRRGKGELSHGWAKNKKTYKTKAQRSERHKINKSARDNEIAEKPRSSNRNYITG